MTNPPPAIQVMLDRLGMTAQQMLHDRWAFVGRKTTTLELCRVALAELRCRPREDTDD